MATRQPPRRTLGRRHRTIVTLRAGSRHGAGHQWRGEAARPPRAPTPRPLRPRAATRRAFAPGGWLPPGLETAPERHAYRGPGTRVRWEWRPDLRPVQS